MNSSSTKVVRVFQAKETGPGHVLTGRSDERLHVAQLQQGGLGRNRSSDQSAQLGKSPLFEVEDVTSLFA